MIHVTHCTAKEARPWLEMAGKFDVSSGAVSQLENEAGCEFFAVMDEFGCEVGAFSVRVAGKTLWVVQAGGRMTGMSLSQMVMPAVEAAALVVGCSQVAFATQRPGLVERMERLGFEQTGVIMRKEVK